MIFFKVESNQEENYYLLNAILFGFIPLLQPLPYIRKNFRGKKYFVCQKFVASNFRGEDMHTHENLMQRIFKAMKNWL